MRFSILALAVFLAFSPIQQSSATALGEYCSDTAREINWILDDLKSYHSIVRATQSDTIRELYEEKIEKADAELEEAIEDFKEDCKDDPNYDKVIKRYEKYRSIHPKLATSLDRAIDELTLDPELLKLIMK